MELAIDASKRVLHSRAHTAGHVLAEAVHEIFPELEPYHGNHDPKDCYVKFKMLSEIDLTKEEIINRMQQKLNDHLSQGLAVSIERLPSGLRAIQLAPMRGLAGAPM